MIHCAACVSAEFQHMLHGAPFSHNTVTSVYCQNLASASIIPPLSSCAVTFRLLVCHFIHALLCSACRLRPSAVKHSHVTRLQNLLSSDQVRYATANALPSSNHPERWRICRHLPSSCYLVHFDIDLLKPVYDTRSTSRR